MRRVVRAASPELLWTSGGADSPCSPELSYRELEDVFLQTQTIIWLGEILNIRFDEEIAIADLLADGELLFQVSKVVWKMLLKKHLDLKHSKLHIYERTSSGKSDGRYMAYPKVDSFLKICQILGLTGIDLFSPSDVVEKRDVRRVCMCIRSLSKRSRLKNLDVPDFDIVTYSIAMPTDLVGGIRRNLEQSQCSTSSSNGCSPMSVDSREIYRQRSIVGDHTRYYDSCSESDEAESTYMEHDFQSPLSNVSLDAAQLSHVVTQRSSDGNSIFEECLSELPNESQMDGRDLYEDGCKSSNLLAVSNGSSHSGTIKNGNEVFREVPNKSSCTESHSNQAVNNNFANTGPIVLPISNPETGCRSNNIDIGCFQTCAASSDDSPFKLDEKLSASAEEALEGCVGTMLQSECLENPLSNCTSFGDHAKEEFVKAFKDPSDSSQEVKCVTGVGECVVSECPILLEEVSHKTCANTTEASNSTGMKIGLKIKSFDEVVDAEVTSPSSLNVILDDAYANKFETNGCTSDDFLFSDDGRLKEVEQCDIEFENSSSELVVIVAEEDINTDLHDIKTNKDIALHQSGKISSSVRTDVTDRISASETESYVICGSCLLYHSICDTREIHSCPETENLESIRSFSSTASRKQTNLGVLDDLQIDRELNDVFKLESYFIRNNAVLPSYPDSPFNIETPHINNQCSNCRTVSGVCDNEEKCMPPFSICPSNVTECFDEARSLIPDTMMRVKDVSPIDLSVDTEKLLNDSIMTTECEDFSPTDSTSVSICVRESKTYSCILSCMKHSSPAHFNMNDVESRSVSRECNNELNRELIITVDEEKDPCYCHPSDINNNLLVEIKEKISDEQPVQSSLEKNMTLSILQSEENQCSYNGQDGEHGGCLVKEICDSQIEQCTWCREPNPITLSEDETRRNLLEMVSSDMFLNKDVDCSSHQRMQHIVVNASDNTNLPMGNHATESKASTRFYQLEETHLLETGDMNIVSDLNEICTRASCSGPTDMVGRVTCADESIGVKNLVLPHVDDIPTSMNHTEADDAGKWEKVIDVEEFDLQPPVLCSSGKGKEGQTGELHRPGKKKVLRSIAGGISLAVAMFFVLHLKGRRGKEKNNRTGVSLQTPNSNQEQVVIGSTRGIYPTDRLKF